MSDCLKGVSKRYIVLRFSHKGTCGQLSSVVTSTNNAYQKCLISLYLFNFIIDVLKNLRPIYLNFSGINLPRGKFLTGPENTDEKFFLCEDDDERQSFEYHEKKFQYICIY
uniref:Uncharacterized protein n=1 Tax=Trichobilharzia regenti TaxID=157069 RepID=A0AA85JWW7_TRIRE|nr:unnamed protein product [Trichobilharzia regenti]